MGLLTGPKRFTSFTSKFNSSSSDFSSSVEMSVRIPLITTLRVRSSVSLEVLNRILWSMRVFWINLKWSIAWVLIIIDPSEVASEMFCGETMTLLKMIGATLRQSEDLFIKIGGIRYAGLATVGIETSCCEPSKLFWFGWLGVGDGLGDWFVEIDAVEVESEKYDSPDISSSTLGEGGSARWRWSAWLGGGEYESMPVFLVFEPGGVRFLLEPALRSSMVICCSEVVHYGCSWRLHRTNTETRIMMIIMYTRSGHRYIYYNDNLFPPLIRC